MSKSVEARLKETEAAKVALETEVTKLAGENDTYTNRMKEMEDSITKAMNRMAEMEIKMEEYAKMKAMLDEKMLTTAANLSEMVEEETEDEQKMAGNVLDGVNEKQIAGIDSGKKPTKVLPFTEVAAPEAKKASKEVAPIKVAGDEVPTPVAEVLAETAPAPESAEPIPVAVEVAPAPVATSDLAKTIVDALIEQKVNDVTSKFAMATSKFAELDAELVKAKETLAFEARVKEAAMSTISGLSAKYEALLAKITGIESSSKTVEKKVAQTVASLGVEPVVAELVAGEQAKEKTDAEILAEFDALVDAREKRAFYKKNERVIVSAAFPKKR